MIKLITVLLLILPTLALGHKPSDSYLTINVEDGGTLSGQWDIALRDLEPRIELPEDVRVAAKRSLDRMPDMASAPVGKGDLGAIDGFAGGAEEAAATTPIALGLFEYFLLAFLGGYGVAYPWHLVYFSVRRAI